MVDHMPELVQDGVRLCRPSPFHGLLLHRLQSSVLPDARMLVDLDDPHTELKRQRTPVACGDKPAASLLEPDERDPGQPEPFPQHQLGRLRGVLPRVLVLDSGRPLLRLLPVVAPAVATAPVLGERQWPRSHQLAVSLSQPLVVGGAQSKKGRSSLPSVAALRVDRVTPAGGAWALSLLSPTGRPYLSAK